MSTLQELPNEVFESIVSLLELDDIRQLRLVSRELGVKSTQEHFKSFFRKKHIHITRGALNDFVNATRIGQLGALVRDLILVGVVYDTKTIVDLLDPPFSEYGSDSTSWDEAEGTDEGQVSISNTARKNAKYRSYKYDACDRKRHNAEKVLRILEERQQDFDSMRASGEDVTLLAQAFDNIATHGKSNKLASITLKAVVYRKDSKSWEKPKRGGTWETIRETAANTLDAALRALSTSQLHVPRLDVFENTKRCSVEGIALSRLQLDDAAPSRVLDSLKSLSLSVAEKAINIFEVDMNGLDELQYIGEFLEDPKRRELADMQAEADADENFRGLARVLQKCNQLEHLDLRFFQLGRVHDLLTVPSPDRRTHQFIRVMTKNVRLPHLVSMRLRGFPHAEVKDFLPFLKSAANLRRLNLEFFSVDLFEPLSDHCISPEAKLEKLLFCNLKDGNGNVLFEHCLVGQDSLPPAVPRTECRWTSTARQDIYWSNTLEREGNDVQKPIIRGHLPRLPRQCTDSPHPEYIRSLFGVNWP